VFIGITLGLLLSFDTSRGMLQAGGIDPALRRRPPLAFRRRYGAAPSRGGESRMAAGIEAASAPVGPR
jgi:hypothetical protein